jgi:hypothetical protein
MNRPKDRASAAGLLPRMEARPQVITRYFRNGVEYTPDAAEIAKYAEIDAAIEASKIARAAEQAEWKAKAPERRRVLVLHHANLRRAEKIKRTPAWADMDRIKAVYAEAQRVTSATGIPHTVDHDVPLRGVKVSGLHIHQNLRVITAAENSRKRNKYEPC